MRPHKKLYDADSMRLAVSAVKQNKMKLRKTAKEYQVPRSTLSDQIRGKSQGSEGREETRTYKSRGQCPCCIPRIHVRARLSLTRAMSKCFVIDIIKQSGRQSTFNDKGPSDGWFSRFMERHPSLSARKPENLDNGRAGMSSKKVMDDYFTFIDEVMERFSVKDKPAQITATLKPGSWFSGTSETGYMDRELFQCWFRNVFLQHCGRERPVLLLMDNHDTHVSIPLIEDAMANSIVLVGLPGHTTHILQTLDVK